MTGSNTLESAAAAHRNGRIAEAVAVYHRVLANEPDNAQALHLLAVAELQTGHPEKARQLVEKAVSIDPSEPRFRNTLANALVTLGRTAEAAETLGTALRLDPNFVEARYNYAVVLSQMARQAEAEALLREVLHLQPGHAGALNNLGGVLVSQGRYLAAAEVYREGLRRGHNPALLNINLASALELANDLEGAEHAVGEALSASPENAQALLVRGRLRRRRGDLAGALADLERAAPGLKADQDIVELDANFGLVHDRAGRTALAFEAFARANARKAGLPTTKVFDGNRFLDRCLMKRAQAVGPIAPDLSPPDDAPVFFVGFPRSGTTLVETILSAHPLAITTGEHSPLAPVAAMVGTRTPDELDGDLLSRCRDTFREQTRKLVGGLRGRTLIDKLPLNIINVRLIQALFPRARVLVALRDPRDCVLSCFMQDFSLNDAMANFLDIERAARTYGAVMDVWLAERNHLRLPWMEYRYEDLVADFDQVIRRILDFTGLGWHEDIRRYAEKARGRDISTPSYRDVLAPVNNRAVGRWQSYAEHMAPALPTLDPYVREFGYEIRL